MKHPKQKLTKAKSRQVLLRQLQEICRTISRNNDDIKMLKDNLCQGREYKFRSISTGPYPQEERDLRMRIEVEHTRRLVSKTSNYIMDLYREVDKQLEDMESGQVLRHMDPSANSIIFKKIEGMKVEELEGAMNIYAELMIDAETQPETELLKLIIVYRYMLKTIVGEAINIEIIKIDLQNKIWEQLESNRDPESRGGPNDWLPVQGATA